MRELKADEIVGGLVVRKRLGQGGMGAVYLVVDPRLGVERALKIVSLRGTGFTGSDAEAKLYRARFEREARTLARLRHPNIIPIHATGDFEGQPFLVMSYFPSKDGRRFLSDDKPSLQRVRVVLLQAARALAHAHENGVLHRDIKLANLLVGKNDEAMLIDFGLAKSDADSDLTRTGHSMGTFAYLAPEYVRDSNVGKPRHTVATDLWAFGCLLYALVCGEPAFRDKNEIRLLRRIAKAEFVPVKEKAPDVPDAWAALIHELLEPDLARRLKSAAELASRLETLEAAVAAKKASPAPPTSATKEEAPAAIAAPALPHAPEVEAILTDNIDIDIDIDVDEVPLDPDGSIMDHTDAPNAVDDADGPPTAELSELMAPPSFEAPVRRDDSAKNSAKRKLLVPLAASLSVLACGAALILLIDRFASSSGAKRTAYIDPLIVEREKRARTEIDDIDREREARLDAVKKEHAVVPLVPMFESGEQDATPRPAPPPSTRRQEPRRRDKLPAPPPPAPAPSDPWTQRYGSRTNFNSSPTDTTAAAPSSAAQTATPSVAGFRIPAHFADVVASAPTGPVIAYVDKATMLGDIELARGAEIHGRVTGASGPRLLVDFTFAVTNGKHVDLKATALGADGRPGVEGKKNFGGGSDVGAAAAAGAAQALVGAAVALVPNDVARGALAGAGSSITAKTSRVDNEEQIVATERGARFFIYIESSASR